MVMDMKKIYILGCTGHINLSRIKNFDERAVRERIRAHIRNLYNSYAVELYCGLAFGADSLFAEETLACGAKVHAVLPCSAEEFVAEQPDGGELFMRLIKKAETVTVVKDDNQRYLGVSKYIVNQCDGLLAIWDGEKLPLTDADGNAINNGGTYHTIILAVKAGKSVKIFN